MPLASGPLLQPPVPVAIPVGPHVHKVAPVQPAKRVTATERSVAAVTPRVVVLRRQQ